MSYKKDCGCGGGAFGCACNGRMSFGDEPSFRGAFVDPYGSTPSGSAFGIPKECNCGYGATSARSSAFGRKTIPAALKENSKLGPLAMAYMHEHGGTLKNAWKKVRSQQKPCTKKAPAKKKPCTKKAPAKKKGAKKA